TAHPRERGHPLVFAGRAGRARRLTQLPLEVPDVRADLGLELPCLFGRARLHHAFGIADLVPELAIADAVRGLLELACRVFVRGAGIPGHAVELVLQARGLLAER